MRTRVATFDRESDADMVANYLHIRILPRRGYQKVFAEGREVFLESSRQPSFDVNHDINAFVSGFKAGRLERD